MHIRSSAKQPRTFRTFTEWARSRGRFILDPVGASLARLGLHPNVLTFAGLIGNVVGAILLSRGEFVSGGVLILLMGPIDVLDGATARARGELSPWGAFVDSTTDRWSEAIIMLGLLIHYVNLGATLGAVLVLLALIGSVMVSYVRARAEALGFEANVGVLTRMERYLVLGPSLLFGRPEIGLWIIATVANITAIQRILCVRRQWYGRVSRQSGSEKGSV